MKVHWRRVRGGVVLDFHLLAIVGQGKKSPAGVVKQAAMCRGLLKGDQW